MTKSRQWCEECERYVAAERPDCNHVFHLLMTILVCGLWLPIWILSSISIGGWRCPMCGAKCGMTLGNTFKALAIALGVFLVGAIIMGIASVAYMEITRSHP